MGIAKGGVALPVDVEVSPPQSLTQSLMPLATDILHLDGESQTVPRVQSLRGRSLRVHCH